MVQTLTRQHPGLPLDAHRHQSLCRPGTATHWGPGWPSEPMQCSDQLSRCELVSRRTYSTVSQHPWCTSNMYRQQLRQQCLCIHCIEPDWGPEWSSELSKYRAQPSRTIQATQSASNTDTSILLTNSITNTNTPAETSKQSPALRGQMIWHAADRRGGECQLHSHRLHKHDMDALCRGMYRYNSNKAVKDTTTRTLKPTNSIKETEATSHPAINSDTDIQIIWKRQLVLTAMITTQGRGSRRRIGSIAQPMLLNHRNLPTKLGNSAFTSDKLFVRTGLRLGIYGDSTKARRSRVKDNIGCHIEVGTYIRGGARHNKMAKACRRFTAGVRATASHERTNSTHKYHISNIHPDSNLCIRRVKHGPGYSCLGADWASW